MNTTAHPLVKAYLDDLERALADASARDREEVLAQVREHLADALADDPDDPEAVRRALDALRPVEAIAAEVESAPEAPSGPRGSSSGRSTVGGVHLGHVLLVLGILSAALLVLLPGVGIVLALVVIALRVVGPIDDRSRALATAGAAVGGLALVLGVIVGLMLFPASTAATMSEVEAPVPAEPLGE